MMKCKVIPVNLNIIEYKLQQGAEFVHKRRCDYVYFNGELRFTASGGFCLEIKIMWIHCAVVMLPAAN